MKNFRLPFASAFVELISVCFISALFLPAFASGQSQSREAIDEVNMMIGTAAEGQTFPGAGMPFGMTQWTPQTRAGEVKCVAPYYAADTRIQGLRGSHFLSGSCAQDYGSFTVMPLLSDVKLAPAERASTFAHSTEHATPYLYSVDLARYRHSGKCHRLSSCRKDAVSLS